MSKSKYFNSGTRWTKVDDDYLIKNYPSEEIDVMINHLGRSYKSLRDRAIILGVRRNSRMKTNEEFVKDFYEVFDREEYILLTPYKGNHKYVEYYHTGCKSTNKSTPASLLGGHGCICRQRNSNKVSKEEFLDRVETLGGGDYVFTDRFPYVDTTTRIELLHKECETTYETIPNNFFNGRGCPYCANKGNSKGERIVEEVLQDLGIQYLEQATFEGMVNENQLYYDFLLEDLDIIIEYQGKQHYEPVEYLGGFKKFKSQVKRDKIKLNFANNNGYKLIEVRYTEDTYNKVLKYLKEELLLA